LEKRRGNESSGVEGIGESGAHIFRAVQSGGIQLFHTVFDISVGFCGRVDFQRRKNRDKPPVFSSDPDGRAFDFGGLVEKGTLPAADSYGQNSVVQKKDTKQAGGVNV
jgi:hypothetical protein